MKFKTPDGKTVNNATVHYFPGSCWIAKASINFRNDNKILFRIALRDLKAALDYFQRPGLDGLPVKYYTHKGGAET